MVEISDDIIIMDDELIFKASRSSGPGGQNVNKVNTRITVFFDVANCQSLTDYQKRLILRNLSSRASKAGVVRVVSQRYRTQRANRVAAIERLGELLRESLKKRSVRKKTSMPYGAKMRRLENKKHRSKLKQRRSARDFEL